MAINVRDFERDSLESVTFGSGSWTNFDGLSTSGAAIIKLESTGVAQTIIDAYQSGPNATVGEFFINASNQLCYYSDNYGITAVGATALSAGVWYLVGYSMNIATNGIVRFHIFPYGGAWAHVDDDDVYGGNTAPPIFRVGNTGGSSGGAGGAFDGQILIAGIANVVLSDANFETLEDDGAGGTFTDWLAQMNTVWRFNQSDVATDVLDLDTFNADETAISGTTVASVTEPSGWGEDSGGAAALPRRAPNINQAVRRAAYW